MSPKPEYRFSGFPEGGVGTVTLPRLIFTEVIPRLHDQDEIKVVLVVLMRLAEMRAEGAPWITAQELQADALIATALGGSSREVRLQTALGRAVDHGILLAAAWKNAEDVAEVRYFANSPRGRSSVAAMQRGVSPMRAVVTERPSIYTLYEQNIGPLTALLGEELMEAEETYPATWIEDAFREAVNLNRRSWKYIRAILERWQAEGRDEIDRGFNSGLGRQSDREDWQAETRRYIKDAYDRLSEH
jgi:DNA replication protein